MSLESTYVDVYTEPCNASNLAGLDVEGEGQWILVGFFGLVGFCFFHF